MNKVLHILTYLLKIRIPKKGIGYHGDYPDWLGKPQKSSSTNGQAIKRGALRAINFFYSYKKSSDGHNTIFFAASLIHF